LQGGHNNTRGGGEHEVTVEYMDAMKMSQGGVVQDELIEKFKSSVIQS
jgi:hypothetical protein